MPPPSKRWLAELSTAQKNPSICMLLEMELAPKLVLTLGTRLQPRCNVLNAWLRAETPRGRRTARPCGEATAGRWMQARPGRCDNQPSGECAKATTPHLESYIKPTNTHTPPVNLVCMSTVCVCVCAHKLFVQLLQRLFVENSKCKAGIERSTYILCHGRIFTTRTRHNTPKSLTALTVTDPLAD